MDINIDDPATSKLSKQPSLWHKWNMSLASSVGTGSAASYGAGSGFTKSMAGSKNIDFEMIAIGDDSKKYISPPGYVFHDKEMKQLMDRWSPQILVNSKKDEVGSDEDNANGGEMERSKSGGKKKTKDDTTTQFRGLTPQQERERFNALLQKAWTMALAPIQQIFYIGFMLYMSGSSVNVFSIMSSLTACMMSLKGVFNCLIPFKSLELVDGRIKDFILPQKAIVLLLSLIPLGLSIRKLILLGFLPTSESDWVSLIPPQEYVRYPSFSGPASKP